MFWKTTIMLAGVASIIGLSSALLPGRNEHISMLIRDRHIEKAYGELGKLYDKGMNQPHLFLQLAELHERYGNVEKMEQVLRSGLQKYPRNEVMHDKLIELYFYTHNKKKYARLLERHVDLFKRGKNFAQLLALANMSGNVAEEVRLLKKYRTSPLFGTSQGSRLAMLLLSTGHRQDGLAVFRQVDHPADSSRPLWRVRQTVFRQLLESEQLDEALQRAILWSSGTTGTSEQIVHLMDQLSAHGLPELAISLGEAALPGHPELTFILANRLSTLKRHFNARQLLSAWRQAHPQFSPRQLEDYVASALMALDLQSALAALNKYGFSRAPQNALLPLARELLDQKQIPLLLGVLPFITPKGLAQHPLLAARVAMVRGQTGEAHQLLGSVDVSTLGKSESQTWVKLYHRAFGTKATYQRLNESHTHQKLPRSLLRNYADAAGKLGKRDQSHRIWGRLGGRFPLKSIDNINKTEHEQALFTISSQ